MDRKNSMRIILVATLAAISAIAVAQQNQNSNSNQNQPQPQQPVQQQPVQQQQVQQQQVQQQPVQQQQQKKKGLWQKVKDAENAMQGQNTTQQGQQGQPGQSTVQQTGQQVQNGAQQIQNGIQQVAPAGPSQANGAVSGGGAGAGSCGPSCFDAGPFQANVSQMTMSQEGGWHVVRMNIQFHNSTNQPLTVAYHDGSMVMVDNNGNTYVPAGGSPGQLQGMGIDRGNQTDSQFVLAPGQTSNALFSVARGRAANSPVGTGYTYNLTIDELQAQNGAMAIPVRTYNLNFPSLAPGTSNAAFASGPSPASGFAGGGKGASTAAPQGNAQNVSGQQGVGVSAAQQQRMVNGRPAPTTPVQTTPTPVVNNAAMKTPVTTTKPPAAVVKPIPATTATKATTIPKKTSSTTTTTTTTTPK